MWKEYFKNLPGDFPEVTDTPIPKIIYRQLGISIGLFTGEELDIVLTKIKRKATGLEEIPPEA